MKFGPNQVNHPTPHGLSIWFDAMAGFLGIVNAWLLTAAYISHNVSDVVGSILSGLLIPSLLFFKRFFGSETSQTNIPVSKVSEIQEESKQNDVPKRD
jgi:hypothetical protein